MYLVVTGNSITTTSGGTSFFYGIGNTVVMGICIALDTVPRRGAAPLRVASHRIATRRRRCSLLELTNTWQLPRSAISYICGLSLNVFLVHASFCFPYRTYRLLSRPVAPGNLCDIWLCSYKDYTPTPFFITLYTERGSLFGLHYSTISVSLSIRLAL